MKRAHRPLGCIGVVSSSPVILGQLRSRRARLRFPDGSMLKLSTPARQGTYRQRHTGNSSTVSLKGFTPVFGGRRERKPPRSQRLRRFRGGGAETNAMYAMFKRDVRNGSAAMKDCSCADEKGRPGRAALWCAGRRITAAIRCSWCRPWGRSGFGRFRRCRSRGYRCGRG